MICRLWRGVATAEHADAYERILRSQVIPGIEAKQIPGFRRIDVMRRELSAGDIEFQTLMWFDNLDNIKAFTGANFSMAYVPDTARAILKSFDEEASHFVLLEKCPPFVGSAAGPLISDLGRSALVIIDVQKGFDDPEWGDRNNLDAEANIERLLAAWRTAGWPVHHVRHASRSPLGKFRLGTPGHDAKDEAQAVPGEPIHLKEVNSGFIGTDLEHALKSQGVMTVVFAGLTTNHCVSTTVRMAANLGFVALLVSDASATFARPTLSGRMQSAEEVHEAALSDLSDEFATIASTTAILTAAGHDRTVKPIAGLAGSTYKPGKGYSR